MSVEIDGVRFVFLQVAPVDFIFVVTGLLERGDARFEEGFLGLGLVHEAIELAVGGQRADQDVALGLDRALGGVRPLIGVLGELLAQVGFGNHANLVLLLLLHKDDLANPGVDGAYGHGAEHVHA